MRIFFRERIIRDTLRLQQGCARSTRCRIFPRVATVRTTKIPSPSLCYDLLQHRPLTTEPFYGSPRPPKQALSIENPIDRWQLLIQNAATALRDPTHADAVGAVGELTGTTALKHLQGILREHSEGRRILMERPLVQKSSIPYERLLQQAQSIKEQNKDKDTAALTFGQAYGLFLLRHGFDPDERDEIRFMSKATADDDELAYILLRYRQSHDFFHALTGLPPTVLGELALKWLELIQTGLPMAAFAATFGSIVTLSATEQRLLTQYYLPWAVRVGRQMPFGTLLTVYYEEEWDTSLEELRARLKIEPAPVLEDLTK